MSGKQLNCEKMNLAVMCSVRVVTIVKGYTGSLDFNHTGDAYFAQ